MRRKTLFSLLIFPFLGSFFFHCSSLQADEHVFISGGPALRYFEKHKPNPHDRYWGNFIDAALARYKKIKPQIAPNDQFTWYVYRPGYISRGKEENVDLISKVEAKIKTTPAQLIWFTTRDELIESLNNNQDRSQTKIVRLEYFGHSNKKALMFDYSNHLDGGVHFNRMLHLKQIRQIRNRNFSPNAYCKSWGCHSGEEFSKKWKLSLGVPLIGAIGKTDYSNGGIPIISTPGGRWAQ